MVGIFPLRIASLEPASLGGADCHHIGKGVDGIDYAVKRVSDHPRVPASEYICGCLAQGCGIATPPFEIGELSDGEKVFASRWEDGAISPKENISILLSDPPMDGLKERLSSIYAFDLFVHNNDRHFENYLLRHEGGRDSPLTPLAPDYSRALLHRSCPPPDPPLSPDCNTMRYFQMWKKSIGFDPEAAYRILDLLEKISMENFSKIIDQLPEEWISDVDRKTLVAWWTNSSATRIKIIRESIHGQI